MLFDNKMSTNHISSSDQYIWCDFIREFSQPFGSFEQLQKAFIISYPKVLARIEQGSGFYIKKDTQIELFTISKIATFTFTFNETRIVRGCATSNPTKITLEDLRQMLVAELPLYSSLAYKPADHNLQRYEYNTWVGFKAESELKVADMQIVEPILEYIRNILSNNDQVIYKFLLSWLRHIVISPWKKTEIFVFFHSIAQGTGKGSFTNWLKHHFFGNHCSTAVCGLRALTQKHNKVIMNKSFVVIDELPQTQGEFHSQFDAMKNLITEPTISVEPKGGEIFDIDNMVNLMGCSNNPYALKIERGDRRYACIEVSDSKKGDADYWEHIHKNVMTAESAKHFFVYLRDIPLTEIDVRLKIPNTQLKEDIISNSAPSYEQFFKSIKSNDYQIPEGAFMDEFIVSGEVISNGLRADTLYKLYESYCNSRKENCMRYRLFFNASTRFLLKRTNKINGKATVNYSLL